VWLAANNLEPKLSPFDPLAVLNEISRLVPGYGVDSMNLLSGNDVQSELGSVPVSSITGQGQITPAHDGLFTSGTLGEYSPALQELTRHQASMLLQIRTK
jgi:NADH-quinone oxidoreductase subunit G